MTRATHLKDLFSGKTVCGTRLSVAVDLVASEPTCRKCRTLLGGQGFAQSASLNHRSAMPMTGQRRKDR